MSGQRRNKWLCGSVAVALLCSAQYSQAQLFTEWTGTGNNWNTSANWNPSSVPTARYGQLEWKGLGLATSNNDITDLSMHRLFFNGTKAYTLTGNSVSLFDFAGAHSWILSDSTVTQTLSTLNVNFAATAGATFGQISARNTGDLALNTIGITGSQVAQLRVAGQSTGKVIANGAISGTGKAVVIGIREDGVAATTTDVVFNGTNTYNGDTFINAGALSFDSTGTSNNSTIRLGDTGGANAATLRLIKADGGQTIGSILNPRVGTSGLLTLSSQNTSNTNTWSGNLFLDNNLTVSQASGGTLAISNATLDLKAQTLTLTGSGGNIGISGVIGNSIGSGKLVVGVNGTAGGPTATLSSASTYSGDTSVRAGTLAFTATGSTANSTIRLGSSTGASVTASINLTTASGGTTLSNVLNPVATSGSGLLSLNSQNTSGTNTHSGHIGMDRSLTLTQSGGGTFNVTQVKGIDNTTGTDLKGFALTLTPASTGTINYSGTLYNSTGSGSVVMNGAGTAILSAANTYTGGTTVSNGTLRISNVSGSGAGTGNVVVNGGGTLAGTGTISGAAIVNSGGSIAPGNSIGTLNTGSLTLAGASSTFKLELDLGAADLLSVTGGITLNGGALELSLLSAPNLFIGQTFLVASNDLNDAVNGTFGSITGLPGGYGVIVNYGFTGTDSLGRIGNGNDIALTVVPEAATTLWGLAIGLLAFGRRVRTRRQIVGA